MYLQRMVQQALMLALLVTLGVLALSACGEGEGQEEEAVKDRPLPQETKPLSPGEYHSVKFKPSLSFNVGKGWSTSDRQGPSLLHSPGKNRKCG